MSFLNKFKNNKASIAFSRIICYLILINLVAFGIDVVRLVTQNAVTSYQTSFYAERLAIQGGLIGETNVLPGPINSQTACSSCLPNSQLTDRVSKSFRHFGLSQHDWAAFVYDNDGNRITLHNGGSTTGNTSRVGYMHIGRFELQTRYKPTFSRWLWKEDEYLIKKEISFVSEYIER